MKNLIGAVLLVATMGVLSGCGSAVENILKSEQGKAELFGRIASDPALSGEVLQQILATDGGQAMVLDQLVTGPEARQALITRAAKDQTLVDGIVSLAVQDPAVRDHMITLVRGMELGAGKTR